MPNDKPSSAEYAQEFRVRADIQPDLPGLPKRPTALTKAERIRENANPRLARDALLKRFEKKLVINTELSRALVSFQANKATPLYRWFKYKEAFSAEFVRYVLQRYRPDGQRKPRVLDPFAGAGTTLSKGAVEGWVGTGIELLPPGLAAIAARRAAARVDVRAFETALTGARKTDFAKLNGATYFFPHVRITKDAFSAETERALAGFRTYVANIADADVQELFSFAALCVLEDVSYTRKDGQYLRWDSRSPRELKSQFNKGTIHPFRDAILQRLDMMRDDISQREAVDGHAEFDVRQGSCLDIMPTLRANQFDLVLTSPPYCNRYDYTRTYALELAYLGSGEKEISTLRQTLLSATVENKTKRAQLGLMYSKPKHRGFFEQMEVAFESQAALHEVLGKLKAARDRKELNNPNIPVMIENYFFEMNVLIHEMARTLRSGGRVVMVNDNVQYHGEEVPVDLILSDFAECAGLTTDAIWVLERGKGNSSQQMGAHGRNEIRKCVYVWRKP